MYRIGKNVVYFTYSLTVSTGSDRSFFKALKDSEVPEGRRSTRRQETARKDVERLFCVFQSRFEIICREVWNSEIEDIVVIPKNASYCTT